MPVETVIPAQERVKKSNSLFVALSWPGQARPMTKEVETSYFTNPQAGIHEKSS
jgi:hypothetical protein